MKTSLLIVLALGSPLWVIGSSAQHPNIVLIITDDQDQKLGASFPVTDPGGASPMPNTIELVQKKGATALNSYVHTPICNPSRSEILTGRMFHNLKLLGPYPTDDDYMHVDESKVHDYSYARRLSESAANYSCGLFGKYLNAMPYRNKASSDEPATATEGDINIDADLPPVVPRGWSAWLANGGGDYIAPSFAVSGVPGVKDSSNFQTGPDNYTTSVIGNLSIAWISEHVATNPNVPFFAYIAPKAPHESFLPAPWYIDYWDPSWPSIEPRPPPWNSSSEARANHPSDVATMPLLTQEAADVVTGVFQNRWRCIMSVDDLVAGVVTTLQELGVLEETYVLFTSDHGFMLGEFNFVMDKRHVYDWVMRVPFLAMGPGIEPGSEFEPATMLTDLAPTILDLAGVDSTGDGGGYGGGGNHAASSNGGSGGSGDDSKDDDDDGELLPAIDGRSFAPLLVTNPDAALASTRRFSVRKCLAHDRVFRVLLLRGELEVRGGLQRQRRVPERRRQLVHRAWQRAQHQVLGACREPGLRRRVLPHRK